jgi:IS605 OrfB family transposase
MQITKSYTCLISGTRAKLAVLDDQLSDLTQLSEFVFSQPNRRNFNEIYKICREKFPKLHSKILQNFLRYSYWKKGKQPKSPVKSTIYLDYQNFGVQINNNILTNFWIRIMKRNFPLLGKFLSSRILDPSKIKLVQIFKKHNNLYCKLSYTHELLEARAEGSAVGIDMNYKTVVLSDNHFFSMAKLAHRKLEHKKNKRNLKNYTFDFSHKLTTTLANYLQRQGTTVVVLENLRGLRKSACKKTGKSKGRLINYIINSMPYGMIASQLSYKCLERGIRVEFCNPAYTSQTCSKCGSRKTRRPHQKEFVCCDCGIQLHADLNAAKNIVKMAKSQYDGPLENLALSAV